MPPPAGEQTKFPPWKGGGHDCAPVGWSDRNRNGEASQSLQRTRVRMARDEPGRGAEFIGERRRGGNKTAKPTLSVEVGLVLESGGILAGQSPLTGSDREHGSERWRTESSAPRPSGWTPLALLHA